jgi:hypothetical protein
MATPVVAGSALLLRQYFVDGYYPSGALPQRLWLQSAVRMPLQYCLHLDPTTGTACMPCTPLAIADLLPAA